MKEVKYCFKCNKKLTNLETMNRWVSDSFRADLHDKPICDDCFRSLLKLQQSGVLSRMYGAQVPEDLAGTNQSEPIVGNGKFLVTLSDSYLSSLADIVEKEAGGITDIFRMEAIEFIIKALKKKDETAAKQEIRNFISLVPVYQDPPVGNTYDNSGLALGMGGIFGLAREIAIGREEYQKKCASARVEYEFQLEKWKRVLLAMSELSREPLRESLKNPSKHVSDASLEVLKEMHCNIITENHSMPEHTLNSNIPNVGLDAAYRNVCTSVKRIR